MRSPVRIWSAAPKKPVIATITGFFVLSVAENSGRWHLSLFPCIWELRKMGLNQQKTPSLIICPLWDIRGHPFKNFFKKFFCGIIPKGRRGRCLGLSLPRSHCGPSRGPLGRSCRTMFRCSQEPARSPCPRRAARLPRRAESTRT